MSLGKDLPGAFHEFRAGLGEIRRFPGVGNEVVDFDGLVDAKADGFPLPEARRLLAVEFPVEIVPLGCLAAFQIIDQREAVGFIALRRLGSAGLDKGGHEIPERPRLGIDPARGHGARPPGESCLPQRAFVEFALISAQPIAGLVEAFRDIRSRRSRRAIVAGEDDQRVLVDSEFLERVEQFAHVGVEARHHRGEGLLLGAPRLVGIDPEIVDLMPPVRQGDRVEEEERLAGMVLEPADHVLLDEILGIGLPHSLAVVAREQEGLVAIVEVGGKVRVREALAVVAEEMVDSLLERAAGRIEKTHAPLAEGRGSVAGRLGDLGDGDRLRRQRQLSLRCQLVVAADRAVIRVKAGEKRRPAGRADRGAAVTLEVARALGRHAVEAGSLDRLLPVTAEIVLGDVVAENEDEIGRPLASPDIGHRQEWRQCHQKGKKYHSSTRAKSRRVD